MGATFGERILVSRRRKNLSQQVLAEKAGMPKSTLGKLERGVVQKVQIEVLKRLAQALEVSTDFLVGLTDNGDTEEPGRRSRAGYAQHTNGSTRPMPAPPEEGVCGACHRIAERATQTQEERP
jgi:transcriptional regulator with XRE-family HTH domain